MKLDNIKILTFANGKYLKSVELLKKHLNEINMLNLIVKTDNDLPNEFMIKFKDMFTVGRGYGYWIWKPYIILNELVKLKNDEILVYIDSSDVPEKIFFELINEELKNKDYYFVNRGYNHGQWTKMDCFYYMNCDSEKYYTATQLEAGLICLKNTKNCVELINEWYENCKDNRKLTDIPNQCPKGNLVNFIDHRHDQSILTNLIIKKNITSYYLDETYIKYNYNQ